MVNIGYRYHIRTMSKGKKAQATSGSNDASPDATSQVDVSNENKDNETISRSSMDALKEEMMQFLQQQFISLRSTASSSTASSSSPPSSFIHEPATPIRPSTSIPVSRALAFASAFKAPATAVAIAKQAAIDSLPSSTSHVGTIATRSPAHMKHTPPAKFTGDNATQNDHVEEWCDEVNIYFALTGVPEADQLTQATGLLSGYALKWLREKKEEVDAHNRAMTWPYLEHQLIEDFGHTVGIAAQEAEWLALRMGVKNADGSTTGGKATWTVHDYTDKFTRFMRALTDHKPFSTDMLLKNRYTEGIRLGRPALYREMLGSQKVLLYTTLSDAIAAAYVAETALSVNKILQQSHASFSNRPSHSGAPMQVNHTAVYPEDTDPSPNLSTNNGRKEGQKMRLNSFVFKPITEEGRYKLNEAQQRALYDQRLCYRCYQSHAKLGQCGKKIATAPKSLNA